MMPKCCEKCDHVEKDHCPQFKSCEAWRSWFRQSWNGVRATAARIKGEVPEEMPKENRAKSSSTSSLCTYTTDPCGAMEYKRGGESK
jgi:hypothetical protein